MCALPRLFKGSGDAFVGLDIGSYSAKAVALSRRGKSLQLTAYACERVSEGGESSIEAQSSAAGRVIAKLGMTGLNITTAVSGQQLVMRHIEVPKMTEEELRESIKYETDIHFPFKLEDAIVDFHILEKAAGVDDNKMKVFMVAARRDLIESHLKVLEAASITPVRVTVDAVALLNACEGAMDTAGRCVALVNIGFIKTIIVVMNEGIFCFSREAGIGCSKLASELSMGLSVSLKKADGLIRENIGQVDSYLSNFVDKIAREVKLSIDYFEERSSSKVSALYIDGGGSMIEGIDHRLADALGLEVKRVDVMGAAMKGPWQLTYQKKGMEEVSPLFTMSYGMALGLSVVSR